MVASRDFQRQRVYDWEKSFTYPHDRVFRALAKARGARALIPQDEADRVMLTLDECRALVAQATFTSGLTVTDGRGRRRGGYNRSSRTIKLPRFSRFPAYVLHEVAHATARSEPMTHGPEFVARLIELLVTIEGHDLSLLLRSARSCGVKVADRPYHQWQEAAGPTR